MPTLPAAHRTHGRLPAHDVPSARLPARILVVLWPRFSRCTTRQLLPGVRQIVVRPFVRGFDLTRKGRWHLPHGDSLRAQLKQPTPADALTRRTSLTLRLWIALPRTDAAACSNCRQLQYQTGRFAQSGQHKRAVADIFQLPLDVIHLLPAGALRSVRSDALDLAHCVRTLGGHYYEGAVLLGQPERECGDRTRGSLGARIGEHPGERHERL